MDTGYSELNEFYKDSDDDFSEIENESKNSTFLVKNPAVVNNFNPFALETCLAIADNILMKQYEKKEPVDFPLTQGFISCLDLSKFDLEKDHCNNIEKDVNLLHITETELINCCNQAEENLERVTSTKNENMRSQIREGTHKKHDNMDLINSILNDFSQSPLSKDSVLINTSCQCTPEFRLRRKPLKTYSRKFLQTAKTNLNHRFQNLSENVAIEYDDNHSSCSSLSIQEDITNPEYFNCSTIADTTQRLCENLLNLTEYFTGNETQECLIDEEQQNNTNSLNLLTQRERCQSYNSLDDFHGFPNEDDNKPDVIESDFNEGNIRLLVESVNTEAFPTQDENSNVDGCSTLVDFDTKNFIQSQEIVEPINGNGEQTLQCKSSDHNEDLEKTRVLSRNVNSNGIGFRTASSKPIKVSREAHIMAAQILSKLPELPIKENTDLNNCDRKMIEKDVNMFDNPEDYEWSDDCDLFLNIQTPIDLKENLEIFTQQKRNTDSREEHDIPESSKVETLGFKTAGGKNVHISKKAQKSVQKLLDEFESDLTNGSDYENELKQIKCKVYEKTHNVEKESFAQCSVIAPNTNIRVETAKSRCNSISLNAKQNYNCNVDLEDSQLIAESNSMQQKGKCVEMYLTKCPSSSKSAAKLNLESQPVNGKRKNSTDNVDLEASQTPSFKIFKNDSLKSRTSFAKQSPKSPAQLIIKKNLLSLTKRRKSKRNLLSTPSEEMPKINKEMFNANAATPLKSFTSLESAEQTPVTPNLKEFSVNAPLTSTPRTSNPAQNFDDSDLKPITWNTNNDESNKSASNSIRMTKLSDNSAININLNSSTPTAKERIDRLIVYGNAPAVSPILIETHHNCRPSGLRRTRSMLPKT